MKVWWKIIRGYIKESRQENNKSNVIQNLSPSHEPESQRKYMGD